MARTVKPGSLNLQALARQTDDSIDFLERAPEGRRGASGRVGTSSHQSFAGRTQTAREASLASPAGEPLDEGPIGSYLARVHYRGRAQQKPHEGDFGRGKPSCEDKPVQACRLVPPA